MLTLAVRDHGREDHQLRFLGHGERGVDHLRHALRFERNVVVGAVRRTDAGKQQAQVVVDLGDGADGGARIMRGRLLFDRNSRRQSFDQVDVGFLHQLQELTRVGRQDFRRSDADLRRRACRTQATISPNLTSP